MRSIKTILRFGVLCAAALPLCWAGFAFAQPTTHELILEMELSSGDSLHAGERKTWHFPALVDRPDPDRDLGLGVMLFAGGLANDLAWTTPGSYEMNGELFPLTISGEGTTDGDTLTAVLVAQGFTVLRYASIREGDPLHAADSAMAQAMAFSGTLRLAEAA